MISPRELSDRNEYEAEKESEKDFMFRENIRLASERETLKQYQEVLEQEKQQLLQTARIQKTRNDRVTEPCLK